MSKFPTQHAIRVIVGITGMVVCASACLLAATAGARPFDDSSFSQAVKTSDLDLTTTEGRQVLDSRLKRAAGDVCATNGTYSIGEHAARRHCVRGALETALPSIVRALFPVTSG